VEQDRNPDGPSGSRDQAIDHCAVCCFSVTCRALRASFLGTEKGGLRRPQEFLVLQCLVLCVQFLELYIIVLVVQSHGF